MEIIFNCPNCSQELSVDAAGAGSEILCPTCGENITIPEKSTKPAPASWKTNPMRASLKPSTIASSAAAKVEFHLKAPLHDKPAESLIKKVSVPLEAVARGADKQIRVHTIRHDKCIDAGIDKFDEITTKFLMGVGEHNLISIHGVNYEHFDVKTQKVMTDYGLVILYRG